MGKKILLVISTLFIRELIKKNFEKFPDLEIFDAFLGKETLELFNKRKYDLFISDYNLYDTDGPALIKKIRALDLKIPVIILASNTEKLNTMGDLNNVIPFQKPIDFEHFNKAITTLLHIRTD